MIEANLLTQPGNPSSPLVLRIVNRVDLSSQKFEVSAPKCIVGSGAAATIRMQCPGIDACHCEFVRNPVGTYVRQVGESIQVNGQALPEAWVFRGDRIQLGGIDVEVVEVGQYVLPEIPHDGHHRDSRTATHQDTLNSPANPVVPGHQAVPQPSEPVQETEVPEVAEIGQVEATSSPVDVSATLVEFPLVDPTVTAVLEDSEPAPEATQTQSHTLPISSLTENLPASGRVAEGRLADRSVEATPPTCEEPSQAKTLDQGDDCNAVGQLARPIAPTEDQPLETATKSLERTNAGGQENDLSGGSVSQTKTEYWDAAAQEPALNSSPTECAEPVAHESSPSVERTEALDLSRTAELPQVPQVERTEMVDISQTVRREILPAPEHTEMIDVFRANEVGPTPGQESTEVFRTQELPTSDHPVPKDCPTKTLPVEEASATGRTEAVQPLQPAKTNRIESVADVLARMQAEGSLDESEIPDEYTATETSTSASATCLPVANPPLAGTSVEEESVQDYMHQLMNRLRGDGTPLVQPAATKPAASGPAKKPAVPQTDEEDLTPTNPMLPGEFKPSKAAPEQTSTLEALRQVANQSVENAIKRSARERSNETSLIYLGGSGCCLFISVVLFMLSSGVFDLAFILAVVFAIGCVASGFMFLQINMARESIKAGFSRKERNQAKQAAE